MKKFKKEFLKEVLGFNCEEIELTMEAQRKFPELLANDLEDCCIDGRTLWSQLAVEKAFSTWIQSVLEKIEAKENVDYNVQWVDDKGDSFKGNVDNTSVAVLTGDGYKKDYKLKLDIAKETAMFAGASNRANKKLKENSKLVRKYFLCMEKAVKGLQEHKDVREPEKENYNIMKLTILNDYNKKHDNVTKLDEEYLMKRECNMINENLIGYKAYEIKLKLGYLDKHTREHLIVEQNRAIDFLQNMITGLVVAGVEFDDRNRIIKNICENKYSHLRME